MKPLRWETVAALTYAGAAMFGVVLVVLFFATMYGLVRLLEAFGFR